MRNINIDEKSLEEKFNSFEWKAKMRQKMKENIKRMADWCILNKDTIIRQPLGTKEKNMQMSNELGEGKSQEED